MHVVIQFCYIVEIVFNDKIIAEDVLQVAHKYDINLLRKQCEHHLIKTINDYNMPQMLKLAKKFEAEALQIARTRYFQENFDNAINCVVEELY